MPTIKPYGFLLLGTMLFSCGEKGQAGYEAFHTSKGWGYNVLVDGRVLIHQETVPGQAGTNGFKTKPQAEAVAKLVMQKMRRGNGMPSVTTEEVESVERSNAAE